MSSTDCLVGRWPVSIESFCTCSAAVSQEMNSHAAAARSSPLSNSTHMSGPAIVSWFEPS